MWASWPSSTDDKTRLGLWDGDLRLFHRFLYVPLSTFFWEAEHTPFESPSFPGNTFISDESNSDGLSRAGDSVCPASWMSPPVLIQVPSPQSWRISVKLGQPCAISVVVAVLSVRDHHIVVSAAFNIKFGELHDDYVASGDRNGIGNLGIVGISLRIVWRCQSPTCGRSYFARFTSTPLEPPTSPGDTVIRVEKKIHSFSATCDIVQQRQMIILKTEMSQTCAIPISYLKVVHWVRVLQLEICEVNVDDVALSNLDGLPLVEAIGVIGGIIWGCHHSACWEAFRFLRQNTWSSTCFLSRDRTLIRWTLPLVRGLHPALGYSWIVSPELALAVLEAEVSTASHVANLDTFRRVQVVPGVLRVLLNATILYSAFAISGHSV